MCGLLRGLLRTLTCKHLLLGPHEFRELHIRDAPHLDEKLPEISAIEPPTLLSGRLRKLIHRNQLVVHSKAAQQRGSFRIRHRDALYRRSCAEPEYGELNVGQILHEFRLAPGNHVEIGLLQKLRHAAPPAVSDLAVIDFANRSDFGSRARQEEFIGQI